MIDTLIGLVMGYMGLFFPNSRTINMLQGNKIQAVLFHMVSSILWATSIYFAAKLNIQFIIGNMLGGAFAIYYLTHKQGKLKEKLDGSKK